MLGNSFTIGTYSFANKKILSVPVPACTTYQWAEDKDYEFCRNRFIWLGSNGLVHKGLDLALEAFAEMPDYHLTVCGPVKADKDFERIYYKELYETPNIHTVGWIDIQGPEFMDVIRNSIGIVYPSCAEGQSGAVVTCLQAGLIPIISQESGVDVSDFGLMLRNCTIDEIKDSVRKVSALSVKELAMKARQSWEYARKYHTKENFSREYTEAIKRIVGI
jgi:glycosyltransferase involved in cell wall biosynthesis